MEAFALAMSFWKERSNLKQIYLKVIKALMLNLDLMSVILNLNLNLAFSSVTSRNLIEKLSIHR